MLIRHHSNAEKPRRTSEILQGIITRGEEDGDRGISINEFTRLLGERAFGLAILVFALPNSLPIPGIPGVSTITGLPITFIAFQMLMGRDAIWLPRKVGEKRFSQERLAKLIKKAMPTIIKLEKFLCPRWSIVCSDAGERVIALMFIVLSLIIALPIPGGNFLPGLAMSLIALGLLERDGLFVACAMGFAVVAIVLMVEIIQLFFNGVMAAAGAVF